MHEDMIYPNKIATGMSGGSCTRYRQVKEHSVLKYPHLHVYQSVNTCAEQKTMCC